MTRAMPERMSKVYFTAVAPMDKKVSRAGTPRKKLPQRAQRSQRDKSNHSNIIMEVLINYLSRHPGECQDPGISTTWIPVCAGMTNKLELPDVFIRRVFNSVFSVNSVARVCFSSRLCASYSFWAVANNG